MTMLAGLWPRLSLVGCFALAACASSGDKHQSGLTTDALLRVAEAADAAGNRELATSKYLEAAATAPANIELQKRTADALARYGKITEARQLLAGRLHSMPGQPELARTLALIDLIAGQPDQAIAGLDQVLSANPGDTNALVDKAVALDLKRQHAAAQAIYAQVLAASPDDVVTRNNLAVSQMLEGRAGQALQTLTAMQDVGSWPQRLKVNLGILYAATGDPERSRQLLGDRVSDSDVKALTQALASAVSSDPANPREREH